MAALGHTIAVVDRSGKVVSTVSLLIPTLPLLQSRTADSVVIRANTSSTFSKKLRAPIVKEKQKSLPLDVLQWKTKGFTG